MHMEHTAVRFSIEKAKEMSAAFGYVSCRGRIRVAVAHHYLLGSYYLIPTTYSSTYQWAAAVSKYLAVGSSRLVLYYLLPRTYQWAAAVSKCSGHQQTVVIPGAQASGFSALHLSALSCP